MPTSSCLQQDRLILFIKRPLIRWFLTAISLVPFMIAVHYYLMIPPHESWDEVERFLDENAAAGSQIVFRPSYLLNFAKESHGGRFRRYIASSRPDPTKSLYDHYWRIGTDLEEESLPTWRFPEGIVLQKVAYDGHRPFNTFLTRDFKSGVVTVRRGDRVERCPLDGDEFICGEPHWERVKLVNVMVDGELRSCLFVHPHPGALLVLDYPDLPPGTLLFGFEDFGANDALNKAPVTFRINDGERLLLDHLIRSASREFSGGRLRLEVSAPETRRRHVCFNVLY
jgi:hypothetical protein